MATASLSPPTSSEPDPTPRWVNDPVPGMEAIVVKTRWFGIIAGLVLVETREGLASPAALWAILLLGAAFAALDTWHHLHGRVFLRHWPRFVALMEAAFIGLLCYFDTGLTSPFQYYYILSLICCAFRYPPGYSWLTFGFDCLSLAVLGWVLRADRDAAGASLPLMVALLAWVTWTSSSLADLLKRTSAQLKRLNHDLERHRDELEQRVAERTAALRQAQARTLHQEKMAAFGLLAAGIAHEVGNPLTAISSLIQMLRRKHDDPATAEKLDLIGNQVIRIQTILRELVGFSRPASTLETPVQLREVVADALSIAKYYHQFKNRIIETDLPDDLPRVRAVKDKLVQVVLNLTMNALDATGKGGRILWSARVVAEGDATGSQASGLVLRVDDDGPGVPQAEIPLLFEAHHTTKRQGTGLGLFVCRGIVEELGGTITYEPGSLGGAGFVVRLPSERLERAEASRFPPLDSSGSMSTPALPTTAGAS